MKKGLVLGTLVLVACVIGLLVGLHQVITPFGSDGSLIRGGYKELAVDCPLPQVPLSIPCLKVVYQDVAPNGIRGVAEGIFGFTGNLGEITDTENDVGCLYIENSGQELWMFSSGSIGYTNGEGGPTYMPENLPSYEQAKEIAENFIQKIDASGLIPENYSVRFKDVGPSEISIGADNVQVIHSLSVSFDLFFNGVEISGGDVHVRIGDNGEILAFGGMWRRVEEDGNITITVTPQEAVETLKSGSFSTLAGPPPQKAAIKSMELAYHLKSPFEKQDSLPLVYLFQIAPINEDGSEGKLYGDIVPATDEPFTL